MPRGKSDDWTKSLRHRVLGKRAGEILNRFLLSQLPHFTAPTNAAKFRREAARLRREALDRVYLRGWPRDVVRAKPRIVWGRVLRPDASYRVRLLRYEICPNYWIPALLYEPTRLGARRVPVVLNAIGHHWGGKATDYQQARCINLARRGMLSLNFEFVGMGELEADLTHDNLAHLDLVGVAGVGLMYMAMSKGIDVLLAHRNADRRRVAVTGLSGGGWQTITISAMDPRVTASIPVAGYTSVRARVNCPVDMGDVEQCPSDLTTVVDYQMMTAMLAPRPALQIMNRKDPIFRTDRSKPIIFDAIRPTYHAFGADDRFECYDNVVPGDHNYDSDNRSQLYRFLNKHFKLQTPTHELHRDEEILPETQLMVGLPPNQETVFAMAQRIGAKKAASLRMPRTAADRRSLRGRVSETLRLPRYVANIAKSHAFRDQRGVAYEMAIGPWRVPLAGRIMRSAEAELSLHDLGRNDTVHELDSTFPPRAGASVFVADIFGTGECAAIPPEQIMIACAGHRPLGVQVAQTIACIEWIRRQTRQRRVHLRGMGWLTSTVALIAAALRPSIVASLTVTANLTSFTGLARRAHKFDDAPALYCFGLLDVVDIPQLQALLEEVPFLQFSRSVKYARPA